MTNFERIKQMSMEEMKNFILSLDIDEVSGFTILEWSSVFRYAVFEEFQDVEEWLKETYLED